jgi:hypothetical protein
MARVFTTSFQYNGLNYTAIVSQVGSSVSIMVPHTELHELLPDGRISYNPAEEDTALRYPQAHTQRLVNHILSAIEATGRLQGSQLKTS